MKTRNEQEAAAAKIELEQTALATHQESNESKEKDTNSFKETTQVPNIPTLQEAETETCKYLGQLHTSGAHSGVHVAETVVLRKIAVQVRTVLQFKEHGTEVTSKVQLRAIDDVIHIMKTHPSLHIQIEGNVASSGTGNTDNTSDVDIATQRTKAIEQYMIRNGSDGCNGDSLMLGRIRTSIASTAPSATPSTASANTNTVTIRAIQVIHLLGTIKFTQMSSSVNTSDANTLKLLSDLAMVLRLRPTVRVRIEGHTDDRPTYGTTNVELSEKRAASVAALLTQEFNVPGSTVSTVVGWGEKRPNDSNTSSLGRSKNRRVEFHIEELNTAKSMKELLTNADDSHALERDEYALMYLSRVASGVEPSCRMIRFVAADVLVGVGVNWSVLRLLWIASKKEDRRGKCVLARLNSDLIREICRMWFFLGGSGVSG